MKTGRRVVARTIPCLVAVVFCAMAGAELAESAEGSVSLTRQGRIDAGIEIERAELRNLRLTRALPAKVIVNGFRSARVTPKIPSVVEARHVRLGDAVVEGQSLASLSSIDMAEAAGELMLAGYEWRLVRELGRDAVSGRRYAEARIAQRQAMAKVIAYGLTEAQAAELAASEDIGAFAGRFELLAPRAGTVFDADFVIGELIEPGRVLVEIVDESTVWVEARATDFPDVERGDAAVVVADQGRRIAGRVVERHHKLDEATGTRALRIEVENVDDALHPGELVEVELEMGAAEPVLAVPRSAVVLLGGRESVFRMEGEAFRPVPISTGRGTDDWAPVRAGLEPGDRVASAGVLQLKALLDKSSRGSGNDREGTRSGFRD